MIVVVVYFVQGCSSQQKGWSSKGHRRLSESSYFRSKLWKSLRTNGVSGCSTTKKKKTGHKFEKLTCTEALMPGFKSILCLLVAEGRLSGLAYITSGKRWVVKKQANQKQWEERRGRPVCIILNTSIYPLCYSVPEKPFLLSWENSSGVKDCSDQIDYMETILNIGVTSIDLRDCFDESLRLLCSQKSFFHIHL